VARYCRLWIAHHSATTAEQTSSRPGLAHCQCQRAHQCLTAPCHLALPIAISLAELLGFSLAPALSLWPPASPASATPHHLGRRPSALASDCPALSADCPRVPLPVVPHSTAPSALAQLRRSSYQCAERYLPHWLSAPRRSSESACGFVRAAARFASAQASQSPPQSLLDRNLGVTVRTV
jgi:hypothetical protein